MPRFFYHLLNILLSSTFIFFYHLLSYSSIIYFHILLSSTFIFFYHLLSYSSIIYFHIHLSSTFIFFYHLLSHSFIIYLQSSHVILLSSPVKSSFVIFVDIKDVGSSRQQLADGVGVAIAGSDEERTEVVFVMAVNTGTPAMNKVRFFLQIISMA